MALTTKGTIHSIGETVRVSDRFTKREFVLTIADNPKYPQLVQFQLTGDRTVRFVAAVRRIGGTRG